MPPGATPSWRSRPAPQSSTRTTIALGHINLARVDLDTTDEPAAAGHLVQALERLDPEADRWVLVEALETVARLLVAVGRPGSSELLGVAADTRAAIHQPVPPTELADLDATTAGGILLDEQARAGRTDLAGGTEADPLSSARAYGLAVAYARELVRSDPNLARLDRARS